MFTFHIVVVLALLLLYVLLGLALLHTLPHTQILIQCQNNRVQDMSTIYICHRHIHHSMLPNARVYSYVYILSSYNSFSTDNNSHAKGHSIVGTVKATFCITHETKSYMPAITMLYLLRDLMYHFVNARITSHSILHRNVFSLLQNSHISLLHTIHIILYQHTSLHVPHFLGFRVHGMLLF